MGNGLMSEGEISVLIPAMLLTLDSLRDFFNHQSNYSYLLSVQLGTVLLSKFRNPSY
jgi:hypothetical protein